MSKYCHMASRKSYESSCGRGDPATFSTSWANFRRLHCSVEIDRTRRASVSTSSELVQRCQADTYLASSGLALMRPAALLATDAAAALPGLRLAWSSKPPGIRYRIPAWGWRASISALASAGNSSGRRPTTSQLVATCKMWDSGSAVEETSSRMCSTMISVALAARSAGQPAATPNTHARSPPASSKGTR